MLAVLARFRCRCFRTGAHNQPPDGLAGVPCAVLCCTRSTRRFDLLSAPSTGTKVPAAGARKKDRLLWPFGWLRFVRLASWPQPLVYSYTIGIESILELDSPLASQPASQPARVQKMRRPRRTGQRHWNGGRQASFIPPLNESCILDAPEKSGAVKRHKERGVISFLFRRRQIGLGRVPLSVCPSRAMVDGRTVA